MAKKIPASEYGALPLKGLLYGDHQGQPVIDESTGEEKTGPDGKPVLRYVPHRRPMKADDVLSAVIADDGATVIVSKDGKKHRVTAEKPAAGKPADGKPAA